LIVSPSLKEYLLPPGRIDFDPTLDWPKTIFQQGMPNHLPHFPRSSS